MITAALTFCLALLVAGCGSTPANPVTIESVGPVPSDPGLASRVPPNIRLAGTVTVATDPTYPPMEFTKDSVLVGADIDLAQAIAATLDLRPTFEEAPFSSIVPAVAIDRYDLGISSLWADNNTANLTDMVTYLEAGVQFAERTDTKAPVRKRTNLCGLTVVVEEGTEYIDTLVRTSAQCVRSGRQPITIDGTDNQEQATAALQSAQADVMLADSPAVSYAVSESDGMLRVASDPIDVRPYGIAVSKTAGGFAQLVHATVNHLIADGTYAKILAKWNLSGNAIAESRIMPASHAELLEMPSASAAR